MKIAVVDCGSGNLRSVVRSLERAASECGVEAEVEITRSSKTISTADRLVMPGQGAFARCMAGVTGIPGLADSLSEAVVTRKRPFLGICVGMQLMASRSTEHGHHEGLNWIPGLVDTIAPTDPALKIPHMGWNSLSIQNTDHPVLKNVPAGSHVYFVHSYHVICDAKHDCFATTDYSGQVTAIIGKDNVIGTQFHPEKSQSVGLALLRGFLEWRP